MNHIQSQLAEIRERINAAAISVGRSPDEVTLVAVSKTFPVEDIMTAYQAGQRVFGENRINELIEKVPALSDDIEWHMIGHLQSNKAAKAIELASCIHSADSVKLINRLDRLAGEQGGRPESCWKLTFPGKNQNTERFALRPQFWLRLLPPAQILRQLD